MEVVIAASLFALIAASLACVITSAVSGQGISRQRTLAEQIAQDQIESIRGLPYSSIGIVNGNPSGTVAPTKPVSVAGLDATVRTQISYVNDPVPSSFATAANYKKLTVTVVRNSDSKQLTREVTYVAPTVRSAFGGINNLAFME